MNRGRAVLAAVAVVALGIAASAFVVLRAGDGSRLAGHPVSTPMSLTASPGTGPQTSVSSSFADITLRHPSSWRSYESEQGPLSSGPGQLIGYLTDQVVDAPECSTTASTTTCHSLVEHLAPGGIVVTVSTTENNPPIKGTATIAGRPALITRSSTTNCADDHSVRTYEVDAQIQTIQPADMTKYGDRTEVEACVAYPVSARTRLSIELMLKTARL